MVTVYPVGRGGTPRLRVAWHSGLMAPGLHTNLTFLGAATTVTGSKYLVTVGERRVLIDSGLFQGEKRLRQMNWEPFAVDPATISDVILTHAHLDHVGYLPALAKAGFRGPVWSTEGTRQIAAIVLRDAAKLQEQEAEDANEGGYSKHSPALPLYTLDDVERVLQQFVPLEFDQDFELTGNERDGRRANPDERVAIRFTRAGHILGSASVNVATATAELVFSGDLGRHDHPVLRSRDTPPGAPIVLVESTYGDREHPEPPNLAHEGFADVIRRTIARGGTVVVPAFAVDRTEIILKTLSDMEREGRIPDVPVYVNTPMGVQALRVYQSLSDELRADLRPEDFVEIPSLTVAESAEESKALTAPGGHGPSIIISSSGMITGGRVLHHLEQLLPDKRNAVVLTGYQGVGTRGRQLIEGANQLKIRGKYVPVAAEVYHDREFSVHADCSDLLDWLRELNPAPRQVFCVHGEADAAEAFAAKVRAELGLNAVVPKLGETVLVDESAVSAIPAPASQPGPQPSVDPVPATAAESASAAASEYRLITGRSGEEFDRMVSAALAEGWALHGQPTLSAVEGGVLVGQALTRRVGRAA